MCIRDRDWIIKVRNDVPDAPVLVTAGGLLHYFEENKVISLLRMIGQSGNMEVVFDTVNKKGMAMMQKKYMKQVGPVSYTHLLNLKPLEETKHPKHPQNASVELKSVHFSYDGEKEVLKDISLTIPEGRTVAFVGPSGGVKTTLANLISRFFDPQSGMVKICLLYTSWNKNFMMR